LSKILTQILDAIKGVRSGTEFIVCLEQGNRRTRSFVARGAPKNLLNSSGNVLGKDQVPALPVQGDAPGSELAFGAGTAYIRSSFSRRLTENAMGVRQVVCIQALLPMLATR
jgi:hypothetical protein